MKHLKKIVFVLFLLVLFSCNSNKDNPISIDNSTPNKENLGDDYQSFYMNFYILQDFGEKPSIRLNEEATFNTCSDYRIYNFTTLDWQNSVFYVSHSPRWVGAHPRYDWIHWEIFDSYNNSVYYLEIELDNEQGTEYFYDMIPLEPNQEYLAVMAVNHNEPDKKQHNNKNVVLK